MPLDVKITLHLTRPQITEEQKAAEAHLMRRKLRTRYDGHASFHLSFESAPGVYCIFEDDSLIYVGQTRDLRKRMRDLSITANHTFRKAFAKHHFASHADYAPFRKPRFHPTIEELLTERMKSSVSVSSCPVWFGRVEVEDYLIDQHRPISNVIGNRRRRA